MLQGFRAFCLVALQEDFSGHKVVDHDKRGGADLGDIGLESQAGVEGQHDTVVECQTDHGQHDKDDELAAAAHAFLVRKHVLHAGDVIKDERDDKAAGVGDQDIEAQTVVEQIHDAKVDDSGNDADDAEFHDLCKELLHGTCLRVAPGRRGDDKPRKFSQSPWAGLGTLLDSTVSICIEQLAQVLDLAANLGTGIGVTHHAAPVGLVKAVGLAFDVDVAGERLGNGGKGLVRLEAASARARDERVAAMPVLGW